MTAAAEPSITTPATDDTAATLLGSSKNPPLFALSSPLSSSPSWLAPNAAAALTAEYGDNVVEAECADDGKVVVFVDVDVGDADEVKAESSTDESVDPVVVVE